MLPFLKNKKDAGIVSGVQIKTREPDKTEENQEDSSLDMCCKDIISAIHSRDHKALASALKDALQDLDSQPPEEGPNPNDEDSEIV